MSSDPAIAILLVGLGIDEISASPVTLPKIKKAIRSIRYVDAVEIAQRALSFQTGKESYAFLRQKLKEFCAELAEE
jgi:phosphotransferase system enzyme I (PtsI)